MNLRRIALSGLTLAGVYSPAWAAAIVPSVQNASWVVVRIHGNGYHPRKRYLLLIVCETDSTKLRRGGGPVSSAGHVSAGRGPCGGSAAASGLTRPRGRCRD